MKYKAFHTQQGADILVVVPSCRVVYDWWSVKSSYYRTEGMDLCEFKSHIKPKMYGVEGRAFKTFQSIEEFQKWFAEKYFVELL